MFTKAVFPENFALLLEVPYGASVLGALFDTQVPANSNVQMKLANAACLPSEKATLLQEWIQKLAESKYADLTSAIAVYVTRHPEKLEECLRIDFDNVPADTLKKFISVTEQILGEATDSLHGLNLF